MATCVKIYRSESWKYRIKLILAKYPVYVWWFRLRDCWEIGSTIISINAKTIPVKNAGFKINSKTTLWEYYRKNCSCQGYVKTNFQNSEKSLFNGFVREQLLVASGAIKRPQLSKAYCEDVYFKVFDKGIKQPKVFLSFHQFYHFLIKMHDSKNCHMGT